MDFADSIRNGSHYRLEKYICEMRVKKSKWIISYEWWLNKILRARAKDLDYGTAMMRQPDKYTTWRNSFVGPFTIPNDILSQRPCNSNDGKKCEAFDLSNLLIYVLVVLRGARMESKGCFIMFTPLFQQIKLRHHYVIPIN